MSDALALSMPLFDLRPPKLLSQAQRKKIPVSFDIGPDGKPFAVSFLADHKMNFRAYITADNVRESDKTLNWGIRMHDGYLTDPKYAALLSASQDFIWSLFADPIDGRERPVHFTLITKVYALKPLLRWMAKKGITRFADLTGHTMAYLPAARKSEKSEGSVGAMKVFTRLIILEQIYAQREKLHDALTRHPWPHETAASLAGVKQAGAAGKNKAGPLSDVIADELGMKALDYVQKQSERILGQYEAMTAVGEAAWQKNADRDVSQKSQRKLKAQSRAAAARESGYEGVYALNAEMIRLRTACYIVIDLLSGVRDSELLGICLNCIAHRRSQDDTMDTIWLHGEILKGGRRPKAWQVSPSVELAVKVMTRLTAPLRAQLKVELAELEKQIPSSFSKGKATLASRYNKVKRQQEKLFLSVWKNSGNAVSVIAGKSMCENLKSFCADLGIRGEDGKALSLKSTDFRPTYARMMARNEMGDPLTLRDHFGHRVIGTTLGYFGDAADSYDVDTELMQMIDAAKDKRQEEVMGDLLTSDKPLANGDHFLSAWRNVVRTAKSKEQLITQFAGALTLNGTGHSWCVGAVSGRSCGGFCILEAKMCVDCHYGIITEEHRPVWEGIKLQQEEALCLGDLGIPGIARANEIMAVAVKVLNRLDGKPDATPIRFYHYGEVGKPKEVTELTVIPDGAKKEDPANA